MGYRVYFQSRTEAPDVWHVDRSFTDRQEAINRAVNRTNEHRRCKVETTVDHKGRAEEIHMD